MVIFGFRLRLAYIDREENMELVNNCILKKENRILWSSQNKTKVQHTTQQSKCSTTIQRTRGYNSKQSGRTRLREDSREGKRGSGKEDEMRIGSQMSKSQPEILTRLLEICVDF